MMSHKIYFKFLYFSSHKDSIILYYKYKKNIRIIDKLTFIINALDKQYVDEEIIFLSYDVNIHGLQLEVASWDFSKICLREQFPGKFHIEIPFICLESINISNWKKMKI